LNISIWGILPHAGIGLGPERMRHGSEAPKPNEWVIFKPRCLSQQLCLQFRQGLPQDGLEEFCEGTVSYDKLFRSVSSLKANAG
jgi:hypothetical protein